MPLTDIEDIKFAGGFVDFINKYPARTAWVCPFIAYAIVAPAGLIALFAYIGVTTLARKPSVSVLSILTGLTCATFLAIANDDTRPSNTAEVAAYHQINGCKDKAEVTDLISTGCIWSWQRTDESRKLRATITDCHGAYPDETYLTIKFEYGPHEWSTPTFVAPPNTRHYKAKSPAPEGYQGRLSQMKWDPNPS